MWMTIYIYIYIYICIYIYLIESFSNIQYVLLLIYICPQNRKVSSWCNG